MVNKKEKLKDKVGEILPTLQITLLSNREAVVEGCENIMELEEDRIRLQCKGLQVLFRGTDLQLCSLTEDTATVQGTIVGVEYS